ncbi:NaeI family type II restriction endonuclease [Pseudonocardia hispaniensis]|uniref:NaeI family type II restriction endonuclease n=1 Tax=Pseudonocardia hispaniensis TaxID=904933 RepID=A0ABW1J2J9_9PSEU
MVDMATGADDPEIDLVQRYLYREDPDGSRVATVIRETLDQLYDGQRTGRWRYESLHKTEKTHMGTLVEINLHREFNFDDGLKLDYRIAGIEVDCKFSMSPYSWMLPPESINHICLGLWADDSVSAWSAGLFRVDERFMRRPNRDGKRSLSKEGHSYVRPLWGGRGELAENLLLHLPVGVVERIFSAKARTGNQHGQARVNELFRSVQGRIVRRAVLATVAQQDDFMKRARSNGGARTKLQPEGILVLGHQDNDPDVAEALGLPRPTKGEFISTRVVPAPTGDPRPQAVINGLAWVIANPNDPVVPAPLIPRS